MFPVLAILVLVVGGEALANEGPCTNAVCPLRRVRRVPRFDASTVVTTKGRVVRVLREDHGGWQGVHLELATGEGQLLVALGPAAFVDLHAHFAPDDEVTVTGSRVTQDGAALLLTTNLVRAGRTLEVRTAEGQPLY